MNPFALNPEHSPVQSDCSDLDCLEFKGADQEVEQETAIYFKICKKTKYDDLLNDQTFKIYECTPSDTLSQVQRFCPFKMPECLTFYLDGKRLHHQFPLKKLPKDPHHPILIYTELQSVDDYSSRQLKQHFNNILYLKVTTLTIVNQKIEFEREKLRKLKEVYLISVDKTKNPRFFLRDYIEYIKKVLTLQLNVIRVKMDERV
jgi:hypothetical protein